MDKRTKLVVIVIVAVAISAYPLYYYVIPRSELNLFVKYSEGFLSRINIGLKFDNAGTQKVDFLTGNLTITNATDAICGRVDFDGISIASHAAYKPAPMQIQGDHYETYYITLVTGFYCGGTHYQKTISFHTKEPEQNQDWPFRLC